MRLLYNTDRGFRLDFGSEWEEDGTHGQFKSSLVNLSLENYSVYLLVYKFFANF